VIAVSDRNTMLDASDTFYMDKIVTDGAGYGVVDLDNTPADNIRALAGKRKLVGQLQVAVLVRPRHRALIEEIRASGAITRVIPDGDVAAGINAARYDSPIELAVGVGGSPERVLYFEDRMTLPRSVPSRCRGPPISLRAEAALRAVCRRQLRP
jgi:fructose-1,6-bisphosphatase II